MQVAKAVEAGVRTTVAGAMPAQPFNGQMDVTIGGLAGARPYCLGIKWPPYGRAS